MTEPWYTRLYHFLIGAPEPPPVQPPPWPPLRPISEPVVEPAKPAKRRRLRPLLKGRKKRKE